MSFWNRKPKTVFIDKVIADKLLDIDMKIAEMKLHIKEVESDLSLFSLDFKKWKQKTVNFKKAEEEVGQEEEETEDINKQLGFRI